MNATSSEFIQAARGPVMLMTLGILISVHQFGMLSFGTSWPVLVIVFGVLKLLERMARPPAPAPAPAAYAPPYPPYSAMPGTPGYNIPPSPPPPPGGPAV